MANLLNLFRRKPKSQEEDRASFKDADGWLFDWARGGKNPSGIYVNPKSAMKYSAYYACIRNISEDIAKLPIRLSRPRKDGGSEAIPVHEILDLVNRRANPVMSAMTFWETFIGHFLGYHGAFAEIVRDGTGKPLQLWPIDPTWVKVLLGNDGSLVYEVRPDDGGSPIHMHPENVLHVHGFGFDGVTSYVMSQLAALEIGKAIATQSHAAGYFGNNTIVSGILEAPPNMKREAIQNLAKTFRLRHEGAENAYKTAVLTDGVKYTTISQSPEDAQMVESSQFDVEVLARRFRMPPNKIQHLLRSTYNNIEEENISYKSDCLQPHSVRICQEIQIKLIGADEPDVVAKHDFSMILDANHEAKTKARFNEFQMGMWSPNDLLKMDNRTPINTPGMDDHWTLANFLPVGASRDKGSASQQPDAGQVLQDAKSIDAPFMALFADHFRKFTHVEQDQAFRQLKKGRDVLARWMRTFYPKHRDHVAASIESAVSAYLAAIGRTGDAKALSQTIALEYCSASRDRIDRSSRNEEVTKASEFTDYWGLAASQICKGEVNVPA